MARKTLEEMAAERHEASIKKEKSLAWLKHVRGLGARAKSLQSEIEYQRETMDGLKAACFGDRVSGGSVYSDALPDIVAKLEELIRTYCNELAVYVDAYKEAHDVLRKLPAKDQASVLTKRFLLGRESKEIAYDLGYSMGNVVALERAGLEAVYDYMPQYWRDKEPLYATDYQEMYRGFFTENMLYQ